MRDFPGTSFAVFLANMEQDDAGASGRCRPVRATSTAGAREILPQAFEAGGGGSPENLNRAAAIMRLLAEIQRDMEQTREPFAATAGAVLAFDVSDLIAHFQHARLPTGIQRVQIETIASTFLKDASQVKICCFVEHRDTWLEIDRDVFLRLCRLSLASGDRAAPQWISAVSGLYLKLNLVNGFAFPPNSFLVNLGTSWWLQNYFPVRAQREAAIWYSLCAVCS